MTKHPDRMGKKSINCMNVVSLDSKHPATAEWPTSTFSLSLTFHSTFGITQIGLKHTQMK